MSNFALVIQLNIPTDKIRFRMIILSKFHSYTTHYRLKNLMASAYRTMATVLNTCWLHGVEFAVMKRIYLLHLVLRNLYYFRVRIRNVYICASTLPYTFLRDHGRYFVNDTLIKGVVSTDSLG